MPGDNQQKAQGTPKQVATSTGAADGGELLRKLTVQAKAAHEAQPLKEPIAVSSCVEWCPRESPVWVTSVQQVNEDSDLAPTYPYRLSWGRLKTGTMAALALKPYNSVSLCMSLVPSKLLSLHWSLNIIFICKVTSYHKNGRNATQ